MSNTKHSRLFATLLLTGLLLLCWSVSPPRLPAQDTTSLAQPPAEQPSAEQPPAAQPTSPQNNGTGGTNSAAEVKEKAEQYIQDASKSADEIAQKLDQSPQAQEAAAGILKPIYRLAEYLSFPTFHWAAFAVMVTGVVSFALQLVLAKLVVLSRMGLSLTEILSDALGLVISLIGLVLTTQAAAQNSTFTQSAAAVLSATGLGVVCGFIFYLWGQAQEVQAVQGRKHQE